MRSFRLLAILVVLTALSSTAQDFASVTIETIPVAPGLHMLTGQGGNLAVVTGPDGVLLVDDQFAPLSDKIRAAIAALDPGPVRFVVNTHWHGDHTGGNENFGKADAVIVAHDEVRARMSTEQQGLRGPTPPSPPDALPVITFTDAVRFHLNGLRVDVQHVAAAHTDGDSILWFEGRDAVHMGDVFFNGIYPFIDVASGGTLEGMIAAVDAVLARTTETTKIIPGHGPLTDAAGLTSYRDMLVLVRDRLRAGIEAGRSDEEILASKPTADLDATWGGGFLKPEQFVGLALSSLR